jgi:TnpA family transposase
MPAIHETAYPRLKEGVTPTELAEVYTPTAEEHALAISTSPRPGARLGFLILLKTFQRLGYFVLVGEVPPPIVRHVAGCLGLDPSPDDLLRYDQSGTRRRHIPIIRAFLNVRPYDSAARTLIAAVVRAAALTKEDLADLINIAIEELIRNRYELPGFTTLFKEAQRARAEVNRDIYRRVALALGEEGRAQLDRVLTADDTTGRSSWDAIREDAGRPTLTHLKYLVDRLHWLKALNVGATAFEAIAHVKVQHFAAEAKSLDAARMLEIQPQKRHTLAAALIRAQVARTLDDLGETLIKRMTKIHHSGEEALADYRRRQQGRTDELIAFLHDLVTVIQNEGSARVALASMRALVGDQAEQILQDCEAHAAYADDNPSSLLWRFFKSHRQTLFELLSEIRLATTSQDTAVEDALGFLRSHWTSRRDWLDLDPRRSLDLSWIPDRWWKLVTGSTSRHRLPPQLNRRHLEVCLFSQIVAELNSGDLCIEGSDQFADYRSQLIPWADYKRSVAGYGAQVGLPVESREFVAHVQDYLARVAAETDRGFPTNESLRIEDGEPVLGRLSRREEPKDVKVLERRIAERIESLDILDVLVDTENWLNWTRFFRPISGHDAKLDASRARYVATTFCYGCNLGPSQTARSLEGFDRRQIAWVDQRHITEENLDEAITALINAYNRFALPKFWGSGKHASADGMKWNLYEQNLLSEYHIRYGGYGGIGYYHVSDTYVALFSHFIPCGVWEAVYILDGLLKNRSDIQPDTVHADTQGQSTPVFGLAYLLGIDLMPRIRNWKGLTLFRPSKTARYKHIDLLFTDVIDWSLIATHLPDMLRVVLSIRAGRISPSTLLRKLGTYSRKNRLYQAFQELGRVIRTAFLLRYLHEAELRRTIQAATNKSETFNRFVQWLFFGGEGLIAENDRDRQRKLIKYNHLVANCLIFHNVQAQTRVLHQLADEGHEFDEATLSRLSPYLTEHVNRFGKYTLNLARTNTAPDYTLSPRPASRPILASASL